MVEGISVEFVEKVTEVANPRMFELLNSHVNLSDIDHLRGIYYSKYYLRDLPELTEEQEKNYNEIFEELLSIAIRRLGITIAEYHKEIKSVVSLRDKTVISYSFVDRNKSYVFDLICERDGKVTYRPDFSNIEGSFTSWDEFINQKSKGRIPEELHKVIFGVYGTWTYTIERIRPKAYVLALKGLTVNNYKDYLNKAYNVVEIDSFK